MSKYPLTSRVLDWYDYIKARRARTAPTYITREVDAIERYTSARMDWLDISEEKLQQVMLAISWIYADIDMIARSVSSVPLRTRQTDSQNKDKYINTPFERLWNRPNPFMSRTFLFRYIIYWLNLSRKGAFLFLSPDKDNSNEIVEVWPINSNRITPEKDRNHFVQYFIYETDQYDPSGNRKSYRIHKDYVVWFRYPNPFDYWGSLPPLWAAINPAEIEEGITQNQKKFYVDGRGLPLTLVSVDKNLGDVDFAQVRADIRSDWENGDQTIAIARAGTIETKALGFTQRDLEIISSQGFTRDKIDSIFFGIPWRSEAMSSAEGIKQADRIIKETVIYPLLVLIAEQLTLQVLNPYFDDNSVAEFDDVRTTDRALTIQEKIVDQNWSTVEDMLLADGRPIFDVPNMPDYVKLPVRLATNPSFIATYYNLGAVSDADVEKPMGIGNIPGARDSRATTNQLARDDMRSGNILQSASKSEDMELEALKEAVKADLKRWKTVARREFNSGNRPENREFKSEFFPEWITEAVVDGLANAETYDEISAVFDTTMEKV